jgi:hypothetical protein
MYIIHDDTTADIKGYLRMITTTGVPDAAPAHAGHDRIAAEGC